MALFDNLSKRLLEQSPLDLFHWLRPDLKVLSARCLPTELVEEPKLVDKLFEFQIAGKKKPLFLHVEVQARWRPEMPGRMQHYFSRLSQKYENLESLLLVLMPGGGKARDYWTSESPLGKSSRHEYWLRCLWELPPEDFLRVENPGLIPLLPFTKGAKVEIVEAGLRVLKESLPEERNGELRSLLAIFGAQVFESLDWKAILRREGLMGLRVIDEMLADERDGLIQRGLEKGIRDSLLKQISKKYPTIESTKIRAKLDEIKDGGRLQSLLLQVLEDLSWDEFWQAPPA
jgi:predicted transposase YdaD